MENWIREFDRFAPSIAVQAYYGSQKDRIDLRDELREQNWNVLITTYNLAQGDDRDRKFFRKFEWEVGIFVQNLTSFHLPFFSMLTFVSPT